MSAHVFYAVLGGWYGRIGDGKSPMKPGPNAPIRVAYVLLQPGLAVMPGGSLRVRHQAWGTWRLSYRPDRLGD